MADPDQVTITWKDATGSYTDVLLIESPNLDDVKKSYRNPMMMPMPMPGATVETDEELYARISLSMVTQVANMAQQQRHQQAMSNIPPIKVTAVPEPPATRDKPA